MQIEKKRHDPKTFNERILTFSINSVICLDVQTGTCLVSLRVCSIDVNV